VNGGTQMNKDNSSWITRRKLPNKVANIIEEESYKVPWYFFKDCALPLDIVERENLDMNPYFSHTLSQGESKSDHYKFFPIDFVTEFAHRKNKTMIRSHITFHFPNLEKFGKHHNMHVDNDKPHDVVLYYINDADGDTFFFDDKGNVIHRETPERGKMVIFDGSKFHSSSPPSKNIRMTLNINYERT
tara:strand:+ start:145 stop:705 length:561 start_codon:yes stop_codon:yes gene_type:complete